MDMRHEIDGQRPASRIMVGTEVAARLVHQPINEMFALQRLLIDRDFLRGGINLDAQLADDDAVHGNAAAANKVVAAAPGTNAGA